MRTPFLRPTLLLSVCLTLTLGGIVGCTHGADDTGGNTSAGSMSGTTDPQGTQGMANQSGPAGGSATKASGTEKGEH